MSSYIYYKVPNPSGKHRHKQPEIVEKPEGPGKFIKKRKLSMDLQSPKLESSDCFEQGGHVLRKRRSSAQGDSPKSAPLNSPMAPPSPKTASTTSTQPANTEAQKSGDGGGIPPCYLPTIEVPDNLAKLMREVHVTMRNLRAKKPFTDRERESLTSRFYAATQQNKFLYKKPDTQLKRFWRAVVCNMRSDFAAALREFEGLPQINAEEGRGAFVEQIISNLRGRQTATAPR